jgi:asparagine synthase (glutamine-hydrolysing)
MCGIAGFIDTRCSADDARSRLSEMLRRIKHRGPDGEGTHFEAPLAFGMRRLSIIDLEGGSQPIWNEDHTIGVVFNGEIYNYPELTRELQASGHTFSTHTDTEVLVHLYEALGPAMLDRLRGMFVFAILDRPQRKLFLARDHFGQKPLYYTASDNRFAFASELKCLLALPGVSHTPDPDAFLEYAVWMSLPPPRTHFREISKLSAGSSLSISLDTPGRAAPVRYWRYDLSAPPDVIDPGLAAEELDQVLRDSVKVHLRADVPVGVLLSSGLDSRTVSAYAQELQEGQMQTFTVGFGGSESELPEAAKTAREIGSLHHELELSAVDLLENLPRVASLLDEPIGDPASFAVLKICELARGHVKVLLSGEGADELFGGYDSRYLGMIATLTKSDQWRSIGALLPRGDAARSDSRWHRFLTRARHDRGAEAILLRREGWPGDVRKPRGLTTSQLRWVDRHANQIATRTYYRQRDLLSELLTLDLEWQLAESLLQKADKMSMGASIELRTPLLDLRVAELAARIPSSAKLPDGGPGKLVLRQCLAQKLDEPLSRPKRGFPVPLAPWFRGALRQPVEDCVFASGSRSADHLDRGLLRAAWDDFLRGRWDGARAFYALWLYETWHRALRG